MATVSVTRELPVDPQTAWDSLSDLSQWADWLTMHESWKSELPAEIVVGSKITQVVSVMGMANKIEWTVTEVEVPTTVTIAGTGMAGVQVEFVLSVAPIASGSSASFEASFSGAMVVGPIGKAVAKSAQSDLESSLDAFVARLV